MQTADYVMAYRKIIPPNLNRWVVFRHGTVFVFPEFKPGMPPSDLRNEAIAFMREHGPVVEGTSAGDFRSFRLKDSLGWLVQYAEDGMFNFIPAADCPVPIQEVVIGLMGRERRVRDGAELAVVHVEQPDDAAV